MLLKCSMSFAAKRCNLDVVCKMVLLSLSYLLISISHVANDSSNLLSLNDGFRSLVQYPMDRVPTGMENLVTSCLQVNYSRFQCRCHDAVLLAHGCCWSSVMFTRMK